MRLRFFKISVHDPEESARELNEFLASSRILEVERHFVAESGYWAVCVSYSEGGAKPVKSKVDYKEILDPQTFVIFSRLRDLRKAIAERDNVPAYAVFTNDQLPESSEKRVSSITELKAIAGVGDARASRYGNAVLKCIHSLKNENPQQ